MERKTYKYFSQIEIIVNCDKIKRKIKILFSRIAFNTHFCHLVDDHKSRKYFIQQSRQFVFRFFVQRFNNLQIMTEFVARRNTREM